MFCEGTSLQEPSFVGKGKVRDLCTCLYDLDHVNCHSFLIKWDSWGREPSGHSPPGSFTGWRDKIDLTVVTERDHSHLKPTCSVLQRTPLNPHFCNSSDQRAVPVTSTNKIYNFVRDLLDRVSIIPYVFSRLEKEIITPVGQETLSSSLSSKLLGNTR